MLKAQKNQSEDDSSGSDAGSEVSLEPETDRFGFIVTNGSTSGSTGPSPELVRQREAKWINIIGQWERILLRKSSKVKVQCQKGIPASLRAKCWPLLSGATTRMGDNRNLYGTLDSQPGLQNWVDIIERDLDRQFPFHEMFLSKDGHGQRGLFRVLKAYTQFQPEEGYCQAQGPVAAVLLMNMPAEEAFWCLVQISEQYLPGYYSPQLEGVLFDAVLLNWVLKKTCPPAHKHLQQHGVEPLMFATDWLMCLFTRHLPFNTLLRVWDLFFCYGVRVLLQVAVVLVRRVLGRAEQRKQCPGQMETLERLRGVREQVHEEDDTFIAEVCSVPLSGKDLERRTEKELERWRKDRPSSTFDPRTRCHGYRMVWARARHHKEERDKKEREEGNLSVPLARSASTLSLSPALLQKKFRKGGKSNAGEQESRNKVTRHLSMGAKEDWKSWAEFNFRKERCVQEEESVLSEKTETESKPTEETEAKLHLEENKNRAAEHKEHFAREEQIEKSEETMLKKEATVVEETSAEPSEQEAESPAEKQRSTSKQTSGLEEESHKTDDQNTDIKEETENPAMQNNDSDALKENPAEIQTDTKTNAEDEVQASTDLKEEVLAKADKSPEDDKETESSQPGKVSDISDTNTAEKADLHTESLHEQADTITGTEEDTSVENLHSTDSTETEPNQCNVQIKTEPDGLTQRAAMEDQTSDEESQTEPQQKYEETEEEPERIPPLEDAGIEKTQFEEEHKPAEEAEGVIAPEHNEERTRDETQETPEQAQINEEADDPADDQTDTQETPEQAQINEEADDPADDQTDTQETPEQAQIEEPQEKEHQTSAQVEALKEEELSAQTQISPPDMKQPLSQDSEIAAENAASKGNGEESPPGEAHVSVEACTDGAEQVEEAESPPATDPTEPTDSSLMQEPEKCSSQSDLSAPEMSLATEASENVAAHGHKRFGLFRKFKGEQPKKAKPKKLKVPKILIQDFSDVMPVEQPAGEEEATGEKLSSRERRRRRRERERHEKEEEKAKKTREKEQVKERKRSQVQRDGKEPGSQTLRNSPLCSESC